MNKGQSNAIVSDRNYGGRGNQEIDDNENYQQRNNRSVDRLKEQTFMKNSNGTPN